MVRWGHLDLLDLRLKGASRRALTHVYPTKKTSIVHEAVRTNDDRVLFMVLNALRSHMEKQELREFVNLRDDIGCTAMHYAVMPVYGDSADVYGTTQRVRRLLECGADPWCAQPYAFARQHDPRSGYGLTPVDKLARGISVKGWLVTTDWNEVMEELVLGAPPMTKQQVASHPILSGTRLETSMHRRSLKSIVEHGNARTVHRIWRMVDTKVKHHIENIAVLSARADTVARLLRAGASVLSMKWWSFVPNPNDYPWHAQCRGKRSINKKVAILGQIDRAVLRPWRHTTHLRFPAHFRAGTEALLMCVNRLAAGNLSMYLLYMVLSFARADHFAPTFFLP